jgi:hypothetical protein
LHRSNPALHPSQPFDNLPIPRILVSSQIQSSLLLCRGPLSSLIQSCVCPPHAARVVQCSQSQNHEWRNVRGDSLISIKLITNLKLRIILRAKIQHNRHALENSLLASLPVRRWRSIDNRWNSAICCGMSSSAWIILSLFLQTPIPRLSAKFSIAILPFSKCSAATKHFVTHPFSRFGLPALSVKRRGIESERTIDLQKPLLVLLPLRDINMSRLIVQSQLFKRDRNLLSIRRSRYIEPGMLPSASCPLHYCITALLISGKRLWSLFRGKRGRGKWVTHEISVRGIAAIFTSSLVKQQRL